MPRALLIAGDYQAVWQALLGHILKMQAYAAYAYTGFAFSSAGACELDSDGDGVVDSEDPDIVLTVNDTANTGMQRSMADIIPTTDITLKAVTMRFNGCGGSDQTGSVYLKTGSYVGSQEVSGDWTLLTQANVVCDGFTGDATVPVSDVALDDNTRYGIYVVGVSRGLVGRLARVRWAIHSPPTTTRSSSTAMRILVYLRASMQSERLNPA